jgi:hypothetical protein
VIKHEGKYDTKERRNKRHFSILAEKMGGHELMDPLI